MKSTRSSDMVVSFFWGVPGLDGPGATNSSAALWGNEEPMTLQPIVPARPRRARCAELTDAHRPTRPVAARRGRLRAQPRRDYRRTTRPDLAVPHPGRPYIQLPPEFAQTA